MFFSKTLHHLITRIISDNSKLYSKRSFMCLASSSTRYSKNISDDSLSHFMSQMKATKKRSIGSSDAHSNAPHDTVLRLYVALTQGCAVSFGYCQQIINCHFFGNMKIRNIYIYGSVVQPSCFTKTLAVVSSIKWFFKCFLVLSFFSAVYFSLLSLILIDQIFYFKNFCWLVGSSRLLSLAIYWISQAIWRNSCS